MKRDLFLQKIWQRYPAAPTEHGPRSWVWGRLCEWNDQEISLEDGARVIRFGWNKRTSVGAVIESVAIEDLREAIARHDWLAIRFENQEAIEVRLLAPAIEKPATPKVTTDDAKKWNQFRRQVDDFFRERDFLAVTTPTLVVCPGTEAHLEPFSTILKVGSREEKRFLPTSPELSLKKLLAQGLPRIFEIKTCFRNGEISEKHQPEFWMLEWYRAFANLQAIRDDVMQLFRAVSGNAKLESKTISMSELFQEYFDFKLTPQTTREELVALSEKKNLKLSSDDSWDDVFFRLFVDFIEPHLDSAIPLFVEKYPPSQAALARLTEDGWGDRFEVYWRGFEIANAYHELNDPVVQRERTAQDLSQRRALRRIDVPADAAFFHALESGMPPSAGIALGLERLFMACENKKELAQLRFFSET